MCGLLCCDYSSADTREKEKLLRTGTPPPTPPTPLTTPPIPISVPPPTIFIERASSGSDSGSGGASSLYTIPEHESL